MRFLILASILTVLIGIVEVQNIDALYGERHPRELLKESETVFVGIIQSVNVIEHENSIKKEFLENGTLKTVFENYTLELDEYTIEVEEFLKNPQESNTITLVQATVSTWGATPMKGFEIGDRVLFYVPSIQYDSLKQYSHESFKIPQLDCKPRPLVEKPCTSISELKQMLAENEMVTPLKQIQSGISPLDVTCKDNFKLLLKSDRLTLACVTYSTAEKLIQRGWGHDTSLLDQYLECSPLECTTITVNDIQYKIEEDAYQQYLDLTNISDPLNTISLHTQYLPENLPFLLKVSGDPDSVDVITTLYSMDIKKSQTHTHDIILKEVYGTISKSNLNQLLEEQNFSTLKNSNVQILPTGGFNLDDEYVFAEKFLTDEQHILIKEKRKLFLEREKFIITTSFSGVTMVSDLISDTNVPLIRGVPTQGLRIVDFDGNSLSDVFANTSSFITVDLGNAKSTEQKYLILFEIQKTKQMPKIISKVFIVSSGESLSPKFEWIPKEAGMYEVTNFFLDASDNSTRIWPPSTMSMLVK